MAPDCGVLLQQSMGQVGSLDGSNVSHKGRQTCPAWFGVTPGIRVLTDSITEIPLVFK
jgi:hypothetical protein